MPKGKGKYDALCTEVRVKSGAEAAIVFVVNGDKGSGFSVQGQLETTSELPDMLDLVAKEIRRSLAKGKH
jgi:hypothetical protein